jgi:catecholate siderophore receptor
MQSQGATSFQSAIRNTPGLTLGAAEGGTIGNNINLNGFSARTDLYIDGMRDRAQYYRDIFAFEQIEILMGPSSMLFGRGSTGGVINQVLKKPSLTRAAEFSTSVTSNGLTRFTADVNQPFDGDAAARVNAMFQRGKASTRDLTDVLDFGISPSVRLGIGTPTEITLTALLQHNHDTVDYGFPSYNGYLLQPPRNNNFGYSDDYTNSDQIMLNSTVDHKFNKNLSLRNQTQFVWVNTDVRQTSGAAVGIFNNAAAFTRPCSGPTTPSNLIIRQISRDRNINDYTVTNQTELTARFDTGPLSHNLLSASRSTTTATATRPSPDGRLQRHRPAGRHRSAASPAASPPASPTALPRSPAISPPARRGRLRRTSTTPSRSSRESSWSAACASTYWAQIGNSINLANTPGNTATPYMQQTSTS